LIEPFRFHAGAQPLLVSMPHVGRHIPAELAARMTSAALALPDTDWHVDRLYDFLEPLHASVLIATHSRYVIDLNRPPDNANLYPGQNTTELVPTTTFAGAPIYHAGDEPDDRDIADRLERYWRPYHIHLQRELERLRALHSYVVLWDAHSIASEVPRLFTGRLPDLNLGTARGASCNSELARAANDVATKSRHYTATLNGRFTGGYITRAYGNPAKRVHALQLELAQCTYMDEVPPYEFRDELAAHLRPVLREMLETVLQTAKAHA
jgi:N-formylglutamate deformylase